MERANSLSDSLISLAPSRVVAPLRSQVIETLRTAILEFRLKPGQRLIERELVEKLGVSRTTVRESIRELTAEGLIAVVPQVGAVVTTPTLDEAVDLYEIRLLLESLLVRRFCERATEDELVALEQAVEDFHEVSQGSIEVQDRLLAKDRFYTALLAGAKSPVLEQTYLGILARVRLLRATSLSKAGRPAETYEELKGIVAAMRSRDADLAAKLTAEHIGKASLLALVKVRTAEESDETGPDALGGA